MEGTMHLARNGWSAEETDLLWREIRAAAETGAPLRGVFERMGQTLGRKPNSVRNYYYMQLRDQARDEMRRAAPFETFTEDEVHDLLRTVLMAQGKGQSVRACVMEMSGGDKARMLRYQNKYRAILRKKPDMIESVCQELRQQNLPCPESAPTVTARSLVSAGDVRMEAGEDQDVQIILKALRSLATRAREGGIGGSDRLKVQCDLLLMQLEDVQLAARDMIAVCKDFLGTPPEDRAELVSGFCTELAEKLARLESISG